MARTYALWLARLSFALLQRLFAIFTLPILFGMTWGFMLWGENRSTIATEMAAYFWRPLPRPPSFRAQRRRKAIGKPLTGELLPPESGCKSLPRR